MSQWAVHSRSSRATIGLAERIGRTLKPGSVLALVGELGAGKTTFVQGLARGLGISSADHITSPTYALMNVYEGDRGPLVHVDFYRLDSDESVVSLGIEEQLHRADAFVAVEWADKRADLLPPGTIWIELTWTSPKARRIGVRGIDKPAGVRLARA